MRLFIMTDLEGASGVAGSFELLEPGGRCFAEAVTNLTRDVNAAIEGALEAGAQDITVLDGDGRRFTLRRDDLHPAARLLQGVRVGELAGFAPPYDAMFVIGAHAMAGTRGAVLSHTFWSRSLHNLWLNGRLTGEVGVWAAWVGLHGVPTVLVTGDDAAAAEARAHVPGVRTVAVKKGIGRHYALCDAPPMTAQAIHTAAAEALRHRGEVQPVRPSLPMELRIEYMDPQVADHVGCRPGVERVDGRTVQARGDSLPGLMSLLMP